jgi:hypothetical protein
MSSSSFLHRQIGIVSVDNDRSLLKILALYLSSDFAFYHAFLTSTQFGVQRGRATLESLRQIPIPLLKLTPEELAEWEKLHDRLAQTKPRLMPDPKQPEAELDESPTDDGQDAMVDELNRRVFDALGLDEAERALVHDLVHVRLALNDGKIGPSAMREIGMDELQTYAEWLQRELDANADGDTKHSVTVIHDARSGFIAIEPADGRASVRVLAADSAAARTLAATRERLREERAQWVYFDRSLRVHRGTTTYFFKPIQRMHWTRTRAMLDAADVSIDSMRRVRPDERRIRPIYRTRSSSAPDGLCIADKEELEHYNRCHEPDITGGLAMRIQQLIDEKEVPGISRAWCVVDNWPEAAPHLPLKKQPRAKKAEDARFEVSIRRAKADALLSLRSKETRGHR